MTILRRTYVVLLLLLFAVSCKNAAQNEEVGDICPGLLFTVPSDAAGMVNFSRCSDALGSAMASSEEFSRLRMGELSGSQAAISYYFNGSLVSMLSVALEAETPDSIAQLQSLRRQSDSLGLKTAVVRSEKLGRSAVLISRSEVLLSEAARHVQSGHSLVDSYGGEAASKAVGGATDFVVFPNNMIDRLLVQSPVPQLADRSEAVTFLKQCSEWTVATSSGKGEYTLIPVGPSDTWYFATLLSALEPSESEISEVLPEGCTALLAFQIASVDKYLAARKSYLDAHRSLEAYTKVCTAAERWARELDIKEVALVRRDSSSLIFVRPAKKRPVHGIVENDCAGYASILFGRVFSLEEESCCICNGRWLVFGSGEALSDYKVCETSILPERIKSECILMNEKYLLEVKSGSEADFRVLNDNTL